MKSSSVIVKVIPKRGKALPQLPLAQPATFDSTAYPVSRLISQGSVKSWAGDALSANTLIFDYKRPQRSTMFAVHKDVLHAGRLKNKITNANGASLECQKSFQTLHSFSLPQLDQALLVRLAMRVRKGVENENVAIILWDSQ